MTALRKYQRLECFGIWRAAPGGQRRDVAVSFGEASLVMSDPRSGVPLAHWSLPAVTRRNPGESPALYGPDGDSDEALELDDTDMIDALDTVQRALARGRRGPGRMRLAVLAGSLLALLAVVVFWLPEALVRHTATVVPSAKRAEIGAAILADLQAEGLATPCRAPLGQRALARLQERLETPPGLRLVVMQGAAMPATRLLPGGLVLLGAGMITADDTAEVAAGHVLAQTLRATREDPLLPVLDHAGAMATLRLLTTGDLPADDLRGYGAQALARPELALDIEALRARFAAAGVRSTPYAYAVDPSGESTLPLIEADPFRTAAPARPVLGDGDWISLQGICGD
jgi:hypothetical protein